MPNYGAADRGEHGALVQGWRRNSTVQVRNLNWFRSWLQFSKLHLPIAKNVLKLKVFTLALLYLPNYQTLSTPWGHRFIGNRTKPDLAVPSMSSVQLRRT